MIGKLTGTFAGKTEEGAILVDVQGVGYCVRVPLGATEGLREGKPCSLFIYTVVREDALDLYGFLHQEELSFFKQLMSVKGVGPKTALGILNVSDVSSLKRAIARGDAVALTKVFGIGKKSAERLVVELRDSFADDGRSPHGATEGSDGEVVEALLALGYSLQEARKSLKEIDPSAEGVRVRLALALRQLGGGAKTG